MTGETPLYPQEGYDEYRWSGLTSSPPKSSVVVVDTGGI